EGAPSEALQDLRHEALVRLSRYEAPPPTQTIPAPLLEMPASQQYALLVDTSRSRLYVYRNDKGVPRYHSDYYITIGKKGYEKQKEGDQRTPLGVYVVTGKLERETLNKSVGTQAAELFGVGAWPLNYPNEWDRINGRKGHGIWLHGTPGDTYSRPPLASNGCVVLTNQDMATVSQYLQAGQTTVVISDRIEWVDQARWQKDRQQLARQLDNWRKDWDSRSAERFISHYSPEFRTRGMRAQDWLAQRKQAQQLAQPGKLQLANLSVVRYPAAQPMAVVTFDETHHSDSGSSVSKKRQYWSLEKGSWKIVFEGAA
ncbi:MAG: L,D-transpeptidase family protein, partial [Burkholderiales bacterium]